MFGKVPLEDKVNFVKNLAMMMKSGVAINEAFLSLASQSRSRYFRKILLEIKDKIEAGTPLSKSFAEKERVFGKVFISLIQVGETSGTIDTTLSFLADWLERSYDLRQGIKSATMYAKFIFIATFFMGGGLLIYILPRLAPLFNQLRVNLPPLTKFLLNSALFAEKFWYLVLVAVIAFYGLLVFLSRLKSVKMVTHWIALKIPVLKNMMVDYQLALMCECFSTFFRSGLAIDESMEIISEVSTNIYYQKSIQKMKERVNKGTMLSEAMKEYANLYPKNMLNVLSTGEKSGTIDSSFTYLAEFYSKEVNIKTKKLPILIEPVLLFFIAIALGLVTVAIIMPIYQLVSTFSR